jgi:hypothetical protein
MVTLKRGGRQAMTDADNESNHQNSSNPPDEAQDPAQPAGAAGAEPTAVNVQVNLQLSSSGAATVQVLVNGKQVTDLDFQTLPAGNSCAAIQQDFID